MGDVYRARDTKLGRPVALKLLPRDLDADADRLRIGSRREAQILASLNHPSIGAIYGFEEGVPLPPDADRPIRRTTRLSSSSLKDRRSPSGSPSARSRSTMRWRSPGRSRAPFRRRTSTASSTAI